MKINGSWFIDGKGRRVLMRGVNLGGSTKMPMGVRPIDPPRPHEISFVGRPFPLAEADAHYARLAALGFNCLRFLVTWEAIEHAGPGRYDEAYLDYLAEVVAKAGEHGFHVFIDPHQDAWSRFSGGDGAPAWTLEAAGFRLDTLDASDAAITMPGRYPDYPAMIWPNNWGRLASATMFTLFFGGARLAPKTRVDGESIQEFLQRHFIGAMVAVAKRLAPLDCVIGYDSTNEPVAGYLGLPKISATLPVYNSAPEITGFESLYVPAGYSREVPFVTRDGLVQRPTGKVTLNSRRVSAWRGPDIWREHGVWDVDGRGEPRLLVDDYFSRFRFWADGVEPFSRRYARALREVHPGAILFIEGEPGAREPLRWEGEGPVVNASHWYDLLTLITKHYDEEKCLVWGSDETVTGRDAVAESFRRQIGAHVADSRRIGDVPTLVGEFGIPFDLDNRSPEIWERALSRYYDALDAHLAHGTLWNYTADNSAHWGDGWNGEDLSIYAGGAIRGERGFSRPTVRACAGVPVAQRFSAGVYDLTIDSEGGVTEVFVPEAWYPKGAAWEGDGRFRFHPATRLLDWETAPGRRSLRLRPVA